MHIGVSGPADLQLLSDRLVDSKPLTAGMQAPLISNLVLCLLERGHEVTLFTLSPNSADHGRFRGDRLEINVGPYRHRLRWVDAFRAERQVLFDSMNSSDCDIIHAHWTYEFALAALRTGLPTLVTVHDWGPQVLRHHRHHYRVVRLAMQIRVLRRSPALTANSQYIADKVQRYFRRSILVVPNGIAIPHHFAERLGRQTFVAGALNNGFGKLKNVHVLIEAFGRIRSHDPQAKLRLAGTGYGPGGPAHRWAHEHRLLDGVEFLGAIPAEAVPQFMRSLDLFVHPSLEESFGMVLLEALIEGTPVLGGKRSGAVPWVLGDGAAGTLVDVTSSELLADSILRLANDPKFRAASAAAGFEYTRTHFSLEHVVELYESEYRRIVGHASQS